MAKVASTDEVKADIYVGAQIEINKQTVDLMPKIPINKTKDYGIEFELPRPLEIGELGKALRSIAVQDLGMKPEALQFLDDKEPTGIKPFDNLIQKVVTAQLTIRALYYKQYPKEATAQYFKEHDDQKDKAGQSEYLFAASASCPTDLEKSGDFFKFNGLFVVVAKGIEEKRVTKVIEESIKGVQAALPAAKEPALLPGTGINSAPSAKINEDETT
ncbi:hypothetical protein VF14_15730 [Nostoc linckia z18]|jgi:hypothetical protein|uniref:Uncharacterized protein n=2 Tax=Nostoc linckia TaxID=92942 RepID=A0A9Q6ELP3_NOSLI|nr:hypothetical protein [Nostoc linckia]MBL1200618.1 hypothetical protein [Nostoc sp. GBBB01]PHK40714.1 hypothetical protein VF12_09505 [Nostoc linckia z15]PHK48283.1 hypothetical protein VF13_00825 [Nostoc linckia z16]PHJ60950.1 hypothetical protein VF02_21200 [Nostoc linckia z1]PHJ64686.1 hypothetical protein VF05_22410 [Nostoc linckia z3]